MITNIDKMNYNPCETHEKITLENVIVKYDQERKNERMFDLGIEDDDFFFINVNELEFFN